MEDERDYGAFREDWDPLYASSKAEWEAELAGLEDENQHNQER